MVVFNYVGRYIYATVTGRTGGGGGGRVDVRCGSQNVERRLQNNIGYAEKFWLGEWLCFELKRGLRDSAKGGVSLYKESEKVWIEGYAT